MFTFTRMNEVYKKTNVIEDKGTYIRLVAANNPEFSVLIDKKDWNNFKYNHLTWSYDKSSGSFRSQEGAGKPKINLAKALFSKDDLRSRPSRLVDKFDWRASDSSLNTVKDYGDYVGIVPRNDSSVEFFVDKADYEKELKKYLWSVQYDDNRLPYLVTSHGPNGSTLHATKVIAKLHGIKSQFIVRTSDGLNRFDLRSDRILQAGITQINAGAKKRKNSTSPYKGIYWSKQRSKWLARVTKNGKTYYAGAYDDPADAARAYDDKAIEVHGSEYAMTNQRLGLLK